MHVELDNIFSMLCMTQNIRIQYPRYQKPIDDVVRNHNSTQQTGLLFGLSSSHNAFHGIIMHSIRAAVQVHTLKQFALL